MKSTKTSQINSPTALLQRAVTDVVPRALAEAKLASGKPLRVYFGIDPTGDKLHLGHAVPLRKLKEFQAAGHHIILLIGSFTAMIGDPSGRDGVREPLTAAQVKKNFATYKKQAKLVLDLGKVEVVFNHQWLGNLPSQKLLALASKFTVQQMLERDMFRERQKHQQPIAVHEFLYPALVGYDSVMLDVDCEIGGNDQLFNMLCGRTLQQAYDKRDKFVVTTKLLEGTDGRKMSKTYNNCIYLTDEANDMYGKVMSIKDELIVPYFEMCTNIYTSEIEVVAEGLKRGDNPKTHKARLAREIVAIYHGTKSAAKAEQEFESVHREGKLPTDMPVVKIPAGKKTMPITELLVYMKLTSSKSEARRLVEQGGVRVDEKTITDWRAEISLKSGLVTQVGSRKFTKVI
jgi:tyrosyl-tRNA synthetase